VERSAAAAAVAEAVEAVEEAMAAAQVEEGDRGATGQTDGSGRRKDISRMRITTAAVAAEAAHGGEGASGHRPSPAGVPGAGEGATTEVTSSIKFVSCFFCFCHACFPFP
jgi:hypothetical protein